MAGDNVKRFVNAAAAAGALALTVLVFSPLRVLSANALEFGFSLWSALFAGLLAAALIALVLTIPVALLRGAAHEKGVSVLMALAFLAWVQGSFVPWRSGVFDGRDIPWDRLRGQGIAEVAVWFAVLLLAWLASAFVRRNARRLAAALILTQAVSAAVDTARMPPVAGLHAYAIEDSRKAVFSPERNVLLLMLDAFQGDLFQELLAEEPEWRDAFPGFVHFPDTVGGYSNTIFSVPFFLTGLPYDGTRIGDYARRAYERSVTRPLVENGYEAEIYPMMYDLIYYSRGLASNLTLRREVDRSEMAFLFDVALFRCVPNPVKRPIFNDQRWLLKRLFSVPAPALSRKERREVAKGRFDERQTEFARYDADLAAMMEERATADSSRPTFKYFHLKGLHPPLTVDRDCRPRTVPFNRENALNQARCELGIVRRILDVLKRLGIYERTLILVFGDHGMGEWGIPLRAELYAADPGPTDSLLARVKGSALPLFMAKPIGAPAGVSLRRSLTPVTLSDIPGTILEALGIRSAVPGGSVFSIPEEARRARTFHVGRARLDARGEHVFSAEYAIDGAGWLDSSWRLVAGTRSGRVSAGDGRTGD